MRLTREAGALNIKFTHFERPLSTMHRTEESPSSGVEFRFSLHFQRGLRCNFRFLLNLINSRTTLSLVSSGPSLPLLIVSRRTFLSFVRSLRAD